MKFLNYVQTTPSITWTIVHNFGQKVVADTWVDVNGLLTKILPKKVMNVDENTLMIEFSTARSGSTRLIASPFTYETFASKGDPGVGNGSVLDTAAPYVTSAEILTVDDHSILMTWDEPIQLGNSSPTGWSISGGQTPNVHEFVNSTQTRLTFSNALALTAMTLSFNSQTGTPVTDTAGNAAGSFSNFSVTDSR